MTLHTVPEFGEAVEAAATHFGLRVTFIEKDYWVTWVLRNLANSEFVDTVVFKGGTSLSKAHTCINRFSEDIDLAILGGHELTGSQLKSRIRDVEHIVVTGLEYFKHEAETKGSRYRKTYHNYPRSIDNNEFGAVRNHILLEINSFTNPVPYERKAIQSMIGQFLAINFPVQVDHYGLQPFTINVLTRERTFFEKLMSLIRMSHVGQDAVRGKIRHFYDLHLILNQEDLIERILIDANFNLLDLVRADDAANGDFAGEWLAQPLAASPLFIDHNRYWTELTQQYETELGDLTWTPLPAAASINESLGEIQRFLSRYDQQPLA
jgi:predicted nucleotidyltransferase component of viral defense system